VDLLLKKSVEVKAQDKDDYIGVYLDLAAVPCSIPRLSNVDFPFIAEPLPRDTSRMSAEDNSDAKSRI
jgi:hypothetical protein